jgi:hypothetical protein
MHLRAPSIAHGVVSFFWAALFFLILFFGMISIGVSRGLAFVLSLVAGLAIFLFVRIQGEERPRRTPVSRR